MKRTALLLLFAGNALALTPEQEQSARAYGQDVLKEYRAQGRKLPPGQAAVLSCAKVLAHVPNTVDSCRLHLWGAQAVVEVITRDPVKQLGAVGRLWVGQMTGLPSTEQLGRLTRTLAGDFRRWKDTPAAQAWLRQAAATQGGGRSFGYAVPCATFSARQLPAGVIHCVQGPGPTDIPGINLNLADGRSFFLKVY